MSSSHSVTLCLQVSRGLKLHNVCVCVYPGSPFHAKMSSKAFVKVQSHNSERVYLRFINTSISVNVCGVRSGRCFAHLFSANAWLTAGAINLFTCICQILLSGTLQLDCSGADSNAL